MKSCRPHLNKSISKLCINLVLISFTPFGKATSYGFTAITVTNKACSSEFSIILCSTLVSKSSCTSFLSKELDKYGDFSFSLEFPAEFSVSIADTMHMP